MRELGADEVINYRAEDVFQRAKTIAGDRGIDAIVDTIGPSNGIDNLGLLGPEGGLACIAGIPDLSVVKLIRVSRANSDIPKTGCFQHQQRSDWLAAMPAEAQLFAPRLARNHAQHSC